MSHGLIACYVDACTLRPGEVVRTTSIGLDKRRKVYSSSLIKIQTQSMMKAELNCLPSDCDTSGLGEEGLEEVS